MNTLEIQNALETFTAQATDLGFHVTDAYFTLNFCGEGPRLMFQIEDRAPKSGVVNETYNFQVGGWTTNMVDSEINEQIDEAFLWLANLPTPDQTREANFTKALAALVEEGRDLGTPILADLEATMKRLSHNVLEHQA